MTESQLYERLGRLQMDLEKMTAQRDKILHVFAEVLSGECDASRVMIDLTNKTVVWAAPGETPSLPATINGLPVCVVAPPKSQDKEAA